MAEGKTALRPSGDSEIHPTAVVDDGASLGASVRVGPYAIIGANVVLGDACIVHPHAVVDGHTTLGEGVEVFPFAAIGLKPQDLKYDGSPTRLEVGPRTVLREYVTLQPGTRGAGTGVTRVGADCLIMAYCHVAHDCRVGNGVIMANSTQLAGHVEIDDYAVLGGVTTVHQFVRVGTRAFTGAATRVMQDVPPFMLADGHPARLHGLNTVGLKRAGFTGEQLRALKAAYKALFLGGPFREQLDAVSEELAKNSEEVRILCDFLRGSTRGVTRASQRRKSD